jgi:hypothetical protein
MTNRRTLITDLVALLAVVLALMSCWYALDWQARREVYKAWAVSHGGYREQLRVETILGREVELPAGPGWPWTPNCIRVTESTSSMGAQPPPSIR